MNEVCLDPQDTCFTFTYLNSSKFILAGAHSLSTVPIPNDPCSPKPHENASPLSKHKIINIYFVDI